MVIQVFSILMTNLNNMFPPEGTKLANILFIINPISLLVLGWHSSASKNVNKLICTLGIRFDLSLSVWMLLFLNIIALLIGRKTVDNRELIITNTGWTK